MKVAIPQFDKTVAPRFEAARSFLISVVEGGQVLSEQIVKCLGSEGYRRIRLLQVHQVNTLICSGIKGSYRDMLMASGIMVIQDISGPIKHVLKEFAQGNLVSKATQVEAITEACEIPHLDLVTWAKELFESHGYSVTSGPGQDVFLVDLVAGIRCPVCGRWVKVAICCGAHTYNSTQEIVEFHHTTPLEYNARVYVCPTNATVVKCCDEYGIELLDPKLETTDSLTRARDKLPILKGPVRDHEKASLLSDG